jgi:rod shape-determining protein MreB
MAVSVTRFIHSNIGIDLGTANTLVYKHNYGIIIREPSVVALNQHNQKVLAIGEKAYDMVGKTPTSIVAIRPLRDGVISDYQTTQSMLQHFLRLTNPRFYQRIQLVVGIPYGITSVEKRAVRDAAHMAGAHRCFLIDEPLAAAIGAGHDIFEPMGRLIVDIGGGTTEVAVISMGSIVLSESIRIAGDKMDESIIQHCRKHYNLLISERCAERIKWTIGSALSLQNEKNTDVSGRDLLSGLPRTFSISSMEIRDAIDGAIHAILAAIHRTLESTPPELSADIYKNGITLTGGGALLRGLSDHIQNHIHIPVRIANDPLSCVALGTGTVLGQLDRYLKHQIIQ